MEYNEQSQSEILVSISNKVARVRGKKDMLRLIRHDLKQHISFDDSFILRYNKVSKTFKSYIFHIEENRLNDPYFRSLLEKEHAVHNETIKSNRSLLRDVGSLLHKGDEQVAFIHKAGIKEFVILNLIEGHDLIGFWVLMSEKKHAFPNETLDLLQKISSLISVATANIIANEKIAKEEEKKTLLLSLSHEIAALKSREDLSHVVNTKIKKLFSVDEFGIAQIDDGGQTYSAFVLDFENKTKHTPDYDKITSAKYSVTDPIFTKVMESEDPVLFNVEKVVREPDMPAYVAFWKRAGHKYYMHAPLRAGGVNIGMVTFCLESDVDAPDISMLLKGVCAQLAVAVSNILANEKILAREREKTILLSLSHEIAALKSREDLFHVVNTKIKKLFSVDEFGIAQVDEGGQTYSAFVLDFEDKTKQTAEYDKITSAKYSVDDPMFTKIMESEDPELFNVDELVQKPGMPVFVDFWVSAGFKQFLSMPLKVGGVPIGYIIFHYHVNQVIDSKSILIKGVGAHLAVAVSNILANERIKKREEEKNLLLSLSQEIALLKNREDLHKVVNGKIKQLFSIKQLGFTNINEDGETYSIFLVDVEDKVRNHHEFAKVITSKYDAHHPLFIAVMDSEEPLEFAVKDLASQPDMPLYVGFWIKAGIERIATSALRVGGKGIGTALFILEKDLEFDTKSYLLKGVCSQLSVAIFNILSIERIKEREAEKTKLLEFSNALASVRDKQILAKILKQQLNDLFGIKDYAIHALSKDKKTHSPVLYPQDAAFVRHPDFQLLINNDNPVEDGVFDKVIAADDLVIFNTLEWTKWSSPPSYAKAAKEIELSMMGGISLRLGEEIIALMNFRMQGTDNFAIQRPLFKSVCSQLAIAISNIIANDEIKGREREKSMLLEFSNAMASVRDKQVLAIILKQQLKDLFGIEDYVIHALSKDKERHRPVLFDPDQKYAGHPDFNKLTYTYTSVEDGVFDKIIASEELIIFNVEEWKDWPNPPTYANAAIAIGLKEMAGISLRLGKEIIAVMNFRMEGTNNFSIERPLFKSVCSQIAIAISNILANDEVARQFIEIEKYKQQLEEEKIYLQEEIETTHNYSEIIGNCPEIKKVFNLMTQVAHSDSTVLLLGETGTGKELIARAIHNSSSRKGKLMIKVNCAALPANLIESELFGHERGSFTGAVDRRIGKFELANNSTLFLDEIGELPLELQVKLLRALQEKEIERIGGRNTIKTDVRIIAATNRDLEKLMEEGKFRSDLYYRLNIFPIHLPPLRERQEDIPELVSHFIEWYSKREGKKIMNISNRVMRELKNYDWPGNIRELEHWVERSVLLATGNTIKDAQLPNRKLSSQIREDSLKIQTVFENEKEYILKILHHVNGRISGEGGAAELLGIPPSTLNSRMKKLGIKREHHG